MRQLRYIRLRSCESPREPGLSIPRMTPERLAQKAGISLRTLHRQPVDSWSLRHRIELIRCASSTEVGSSKPTMLLHIAINGINLSHHGGISVATEAVPLLIRGTATRHSQGRSSGADLEVSIRAPGLSRNRDPAQRMTGTHCTEETEVDPTYRLLIDGEFVQGSSTFDVVNPATGAPFAMCPKADEALLERAVAAAKRAFGAWSAKPLKERSKLVNALADRLEERSDAFAQLLTSEQGKPLAQARREIMGGILNLRAFAQMRLEPKVLIDDASRRVLEHRTPLGVVAAITPWNFPIILLINKLGPALLAGNTLVVKPAPTTPLTTLLFGEICRELLPRGVVNIICDENDLGPLLVAHKDVAKVAFTGSAATGKKVMASAAQGLKRLTLELGGNDSAIVLDDVDPVAVAGKIFKAAMSNAGQICVAVKRAYVPEALYDPFCDELARLAEEMVVDDGDKPGSEMGPVQNRAQFERISALVADARLNGRIIAGGAALDRPGFFFPPTIVCDLPDDAALVREEQFGPVLPVLKYKDIDDVIRRSNDSDYGLGGIVWGTDVDRATAVAMQMNSGSIWVNQHMASDPMIPFRGAKQSGIGTELGEEGLFEFTQPHIVDVAFAVK